MAHGKKSSNNFLGPMQNVCSEMRKFYPFWEGKMIYFELEKNFLNFPVGICENPNVNPSKVGKCTIKNRGIEVKGVDRN